MSKYRKFLIALLAPLGLLALALSDGHVDGTEASTILGALLVALGVRQVTNAAGEVPQGQDQG